MSSVKYTNDYGVCADCSDSDPSWAIVNRGLYVCDECCSVHRSLGHHISQIKCLSAEWRPTTLSMVKTLHQADVNTFWEHSVSDSNNYKEKPSPKDPIYDKKDFIRAKHGQQSFIPKTSDTRDDLNRQLRSSVRTSNLETSLKILARGADSNYCHPEKGNYPLHVAAKAGQILQIELLLIYGANPYAVDRKGNTPATCAKLSGYEDVYERLNDSEYEVLDVLSAYAFGNKLKRKNGNPTIDFDLNVENLKDGDRQEVIKKIQKLPNYLFEELMIDTFDELDRRETEKIWQNKNAQSHVSVTFLPVNPDVSPMKNQGRQKLACYGENEFKNFVKQILIEVHRRNRPVNKISKLKCDDEEPLLHDRVASGATPEQITVTSNNDVYKTKFFESEAKISKLISEIDSLKKKIEEVSKENTELKCKTIQQNQPAVANNNNGNKEYGDNRPHYIRPVSMYESREGINCDLFEKAGELPLSNDVIRLTDQVTKCIQELWTNIKPSDTCKSFVPCAEKIKTSVDELTAIFPQAIEDDVVKSTLWSLNTNITQLQHECACMEDGIERVRNCSFNMANATKQLLTKF